MKKMNYESLDLEIIKFESADVIVTSPQGGNDDTSEDGP